MYSIDSTSYLDNMLASLGDPISNACRVRKIMEQVLLLQLKSGVQELDACTGMKACKLAPCAPEKSCGSVRQAQSSISQTCFCLRRVIPLACEEQGLSDTCRISGLDIRMLNESFCTIMNRLCKEPWMTELGH